MYLEPIPPRTDQFNYRIVKKELPQVIQITINKKIKKEKTIFNPKSQENKRKEQKQM